MLRAYLGHLCTDEKRGMWRNALTAPWSASEFHPSDDVRDERKLIKMGRRGSASEAKPLSKWGSDDSVITLILLRPYVDAGMVKVVDVTESPVGTWISVTV